MSPSGQKAAKFLRFVEFLCLSLLVLAFYLLYLSRTGEARTVWEVLHPAFMPTLIVATSILLMILQTSERIAYKLLFVIVYSILIHSLFSIIFPAGDLSGQQIVLGRTVRLYDDSIIHGWPPWPLGNVFSEIFTRFSGINFQMAVSVTFARMFSMDVLEAHLFLVPVLWGIFTPIAAYLTTYEIYQSEKAAVLSSLLISAFPYATYFGAISVPNSLGFIFLFYALYFMLKNLDSEDSRTKFLMLAFSFFSLLSHYLTGIMSLSLLILALTFKSYKNEKPPSFISKASLLGSFVFCSSLLPLSLVYLRFFRPGTLTAFTLDKLYQLPVEESIGLFFIGELIHGFNLETILIVIAGPLLAFLCMLYTLFKSNRSRDARFRSLVIFFFAAFLLVSVDYRVLKLFMVGLPLNEERLWVFRDFIAAPFVALVAFQVYSSISSPLKARSLSVLSPSNIRLVSKAGVLQVASLLLSLNVLISVVFGGWVSLSLTVAYPKIAPLQTTWYEIEAVKYIEENTKEKYVVIGDIWTIFAGEVIVGVYNPRAYYFGEYETKGIELFNKMREEPSPEVMIEAMNSTGADTTTAYFIITEPRVGTEEFDTVVSRALQNGQLRVENVFGSGRLFVFSYRKEQRV